MSRSELLDVMIEHQLITEESVTNWINKLFYTVVPEGAAPWDLFMFEEWNLEERNTFDSIVRFYTNDAHTVFQATMMGSWNACNLQSPLNDYIKQGMSVLEYGSGGGRETVGCLKAGAEVTCCDVSERLLSSLSLLAQKYSKKITPILIKEDVPSLPKEQFDFVITIDCLEHVREPVKVLKELVSCLKSGGFIYNEVFFGGHELSPYHLVETRHYGNGTEWHDVLVEAGLIQIDGNLWKKL